MYMKERKKEKFNFLVATCSWASLWSAINMLVLIDLFSKVFFGQVLDNLFFKMVISLWKDIYFMPPPPPKQNILSHIRVRINNFLV
jgi:hypothetical protein